MRLFFGVVVVILALFGACANPTGPSRRELLVSIPQIGIGAHSTTGRKVVVPARGTADLVIRWHPRPPEANLGVFLFKSDQDQVRCIQGDCSSALVSVTDSTFPKAFDWPTNRGEIFLLIVNSGGSDAIGSGEVGFVRGG